MSHDLIERYIYAVLKNLPARQRADIEAELKELISDMLEERCADLVPSERDIRVVLTELGTPSELAAKYHSDGEKCLIGPPYYSKYKLVMKIVSISVVFGMSMVSLITTLMGETSSWYMGLFSWLGNTFSSLIWAFAFVTALFAFFQWRNVDFGPELGDDLSSLPPVPKKDEVISRWECIAGIVISVLFAVVFLFAPQMITAVLGEAGNFEFIPVFNIQEIQRIWYLILSFSALGILKECVKLYEGRYTKLLAAVTVATNCVSGVFSWLFLANGKVINLQFIRSMSELFGPNETLIVHAFENFHLFFLGVILFALVLDTALVVYKAIKYN